MNTTRVRVRVDSPSRSYFSRLAVVFADPVRLKIVTELFRREMSPSQFFGLYGGGTLSRIDRHFKRLAEHDWLRLVRKETGGGRRGGTQNFYRAPKLAVFDNEDWARLSSPLRSEFSWRIFEQFAERVKDAFEAGTFDGRPERHFTWTPLVLDEAGRKRVIGMIDSPFTALFEEQADARVRLAHSGEVPIHVTVGLAAFDSPRQERNRSGLVLPDPPSDYSPDDPAFTVRVARVFASEVNLKIVTELSLREMSPSQFSEEVGGGQVPEISRRFKMLSEEGWLVEVRKESGGRRRGASRPSTARPCQPSSILAIGRGCQTRSGGRLAGASSNSSQSRCARRWMREPLTSGRIVTTPGRPACWTSKAGDKSSKRWIASSTGC